MTETRKTAKLEKLLRLMAEMVLRKYHPRIIAVTGSVGKSSTKEAIFCVLSDHFSVRRSEKNYNNEIGVPLTILGEESGEHSLLRWSGIIFRWIGRMLLPLNYPEILILEMGADRPGDLEYLTSFARPDISVITEVSSSHLEYFKSLGAILKEKTTLVRALADNGLAIINGDNPDLAKLKDNPRQKGANVRISLFGFGEQCDVRATDVLMNYRNGNPASSADNPSGLSFKLSHKGATMPVRLDNILARHNIYAALAAISVGIELGMNLVEIAKSLENFSLPSGRTNLIKGIKDSWIIDDTYNASLVSGEGALEILRELGSGRKIAVMGDMLELGEDTENDHRALAKKFLEIGGDVFLSVGKRMLFAADELKRHKFAGTVQAFPDPLTAGRQLQEIIQSGDVILVKGSQAMRMEKVVEEVMAEPQRAKELLCRQSEEWKKKPWREV